MTLPTAKMALLHAKARSLAICSHKPQKTATYNGLVSRFTGESRGHSEKTMCRQRHKSDLRHRETLFLSCRRSLRSPPHCPPTPAALLSAALPRRSRDLQTHRLDRKSTRLNYSHYCAPPMPSSA